MSSLTGEQLARIEENRKKALERRALRAKIEANRQKALQIQAARIKDQHVPLSAFKVQSPSSSSPSSSSLKEQIIDIPKETIVTSPPIKKVKHWVNKETPITFKQSVAFTPSKNIVSGHCQIISKEHFVVEVNYHKVMIDIFKKIKSANYDSTSKNWKFNVRDHDELLKELRVLKGEVVISGIPRKILDLFLKPPVDFRKQDIDISAIDSHLLNHLMPFQREGILFGIARKGRCLIADDMGLGKTIQALGIAHYYQNDWPLIVVCPTSVRFHWLEAIHDWLPSVQPHTINVMTSGRDFDASAKIIITSYNLVSRHVQILNRIAFGIVIVDESHFLKTHSSARSKAVCGLLKNCRRVILLSGTPALSRPCELFTQLNAIDPSTFPHFREYGIRYCSGKQTNMGFWDYNGCSNMKELHLVLQQSVMIRRLKSEVISQLPSKLRQMILLKLDDISSNEDIKDFERALQNKRLKGMERRGTLLQYYAVSGKCKLPVIIDYLNDQLESGKKFIIFAHHKVVIDNICETISKKNVDFIRIDGSTTSLCRKQMCEKFQLNEKCLVAVLSITAANAGITLTAAQLVIFAELFWNPGILTQAEDRAHRIGQKDCVLVQYLVSPGTADDHLWPLIQSKLEVLNKAGLSKDSFQTCATSTVVCKRTDQKSITDFFGALEDDDEDDILLKALDSLV
ncbi:hypothetical protein R5R35_006630 [Gryllus longicercus]|uniref:SWI/SNF-related matrix-associated actin-dependent regulator of chromatin subfamily A-like protein 1 n=1 Tax=Gryllus longicercus TaxID=2509291 RepID=A0AAN9VW45_9ORTH